MNPLVLVPINYSLNLINNTNKKETNHIEIKLSTLETINVKFPKEEWLHVFTNGSYIRD